jgi:hypothetical protein
MHTRWAEVLRLCQRGATEMSAKLRWAKKSHTLVADR